LEGTIYNDINDNRILDAGEPVSANWTVELRASSGNCSSGNVIATTTTINSGAYAFVNLNTGTYTVCPVLPGWKQTLFVGTTVIGPVKYVNVPVVRDTGERNIACRLTAFGVVFCTF